MSSFSQEQTVSLVPCAKEVLNEERATIASVTLSRGTSSIAPLTYEFYVGKIPWEMKITSDAGNAELSFTCEKATLAMNWGLTAEIKTYFASSIGEEDSLLKKTVSNTSGASDPLKYPLIKMIKEKFHSHNRTHKVAVSKEEYQLLLPKGWQNHYGNIPGSHSLHLTIQVAIKNSWGLRHRTVFNYDFTKQSELSNLILLIEGKQVFVDIRFLGHFSSFFFRYTQGDNMKELKIDNATQLPILPLENVSYKSFIDLLNVIYPCGAAITEDNVEGLLQVSHYLAFETVLMKCEEFLINLKDNRNNSGASQHLKNLFTNFQHSFTYQMSALQSHCLSQMTSSRTLAGLKNDSIYAQLSEEVKSVILDRIMTLINEGR